MNLTRHKYSHGKYCNGDVIYLAFIYSRSCYHAIVCDYLIYAIFLPRKIFNINLASSSSSSFYPALGHKPSTNSCQVFVTLVLLQPHPCPPNVIHLSPILFSMYFQMSLYFCCSVGSRDGLSSYILFSAFPFHHQYLFITSLIHLNFFSSLNLVLSISSALVILSALL